MSDEDGGDEDGGDEDGGYHGEIARGTAFVLVGTVVSMGLGFVVRTVLARFLEPSGYGVLMLGISVSALLAMVAKLGLPGGVARTLARVDAGEKRAVTLSALTASVGLSVVIAGGLFLAAEPAATRVFDDPGVAPVLRVMSLLVPIVTAQAVIVAAFRGERRVLERVLVDNLLSPVSRLGLVLVALMLGLGVVGAAVAWTGGMVITTAVALYLLYDRTALFRIERFEPRYASLLSFSLPLLISSLLWNLVQWMDNVLLGYFLTSADVGVYDASFFVGRLLIAVLSAFGFLFMPMFSELHADGARGRMGELYTSVTEWSVALVLPLYLVLFLFSRTVLVGLFGTGYAGGRLALIVIATGFLVHVLSGLSGDALVAMGHTRYVMYGNVATGVVNFGLNVWLIPVLGITGAAIASAFSYAVFNLLFLYKLNDEAGLRPFDVSFLPTVALGSVGMIAAGVGIDGLVSVELWMLPGVLVVFYLVLGVALVGTKEPSEGDRQLVRAIRAKIGPLLDRYRPRIRTE